MKFNVTNIQFFEHRVPVQTSEDGDFEYEVSYSANVAINDDFMIQCSGDLNECKYSIPAADEAAWNDDNKQDHAFENYDLDEIIAQIEADGFENNINYLSENGEKML